VAIPQLGCFSEEEISKHIKQKSSTSIACKALY